MECFIGVRSGLIIYAVIGAVAWLLSGCEHIPIFDDAWNRHTTVSTTTTTTGK